MSSRLSLHSSYYVDTKIDPAAVTNYGGLFPYLDLMLLAELPRTVTDCLPTAARKIPVDTARDKRKSARQR